MIENLLFLLLGAVFFSTVLATMNLPSPRSPRDRKTKSPGSFGSGSMSISPVPLESPRTSPRFKRKKTVSISETNSFHEYAEDFEEPTFENLQNLVGKDDSPQTITFQFPPMPQPILKRRLIITKKYPTTIHLFRKCSQTDLTRFYSQGTQLSGSPSAINDMLKYLIESGQNGKLAIIYQHDKVNLLEFVMKGASVTTSNVLALLPVIFGENEEIVLEVESYSHSSFAIRAALFLYAVDFKIEHVYKMFNELIDDEEPLSESKMVARELLNLYYKDEGRMPFLAYAAKHDSEEALQNIVDFEPSEVERLDSKGCSVLFHAAAEGNLGILEALKEQVKGKPLPGQCPLIAAAIHNRDDSLAFFLEEGNKEYFNFSPKDIEDTAFTSAVAGNIGIVRVLLRMTNLNLYCYRGDNTLLSVALKNDKYGYAGLLVERYGYNVNFVGEDPINPNGNALKFVLDKPGTAEIFLKKGANRDILVPVIVKDTETDPDGPVTYMPLKEYLDIFGNEKLIKLFNKYS